jgi:hypothetical protein
MATIFTLRIACDGAIFDTPISQPDGRKIAFWRGSDLRLELALLNRGQLEDLTNVATIGVELRAIGPDDSPPDGSMPPLLSREIGVDDLNLEMTMEEWTQGSGQQAIVHFSHGETSIPAGDVWLVIWARTVDEPEQIVTYAAGRISVRESSLGGGGGGDIPVEDLPSSSYLLRTANLSDLLTPAVARQNLGLGGAALLNALDEDDLESDSLQLPTQRSVKAYADTIGEDVKTYADGAVANVLEDGKSYADGIGAAAIAYVDEQLAQIPSTGDGGNSPVNYWPSNIFFSSSGYVAKPYFSNAGGVSAVDGWWIYQSSADVSNKTFFYGRPAEPTSLSGVYDLCYERTDGNTKVNVCYMNRPLTQEETEPLRGQTINWSFDLQYGEDFPQNVADSGVVMAVNGCTTAGTLTTVNYYGVFSSGATVIAQREPILSCPTDAFARFALTFTVPENVFQICLRIQHKPNGTGQSVGASHRFLLRHPMLTIGSSQAEYVPIPHYLDQLATNRRFIRCLATYDGPVTGGQVISQRIQFPVPMEKIPICTRAVEQDSAIGFGTAVTGNAMQISNRDCLISRTATADSASGHFRTLYSFAACLWTHDNTIGNY